MARRTKPPVADWIQRERKRLGLSVDQLVERLDLIGVHVGRQTIQVWESYADRKPKPDTLDALERIFDSPAPNRETGPAQGEAGLGALVVALSGFVDELREDRRIRQEQIGALLQSIQEDRMARQEWETGFLGAMLELATIATRQDGPRDELPAGAPAHAGH